MEETICFTSGELAQMLGISKQTVIYYDRVGLLSPAGRGPQNYRRYTLDQADELDTILTLRNLGVPIEEIKDYLREKSPDRCIRMLRRQEAFAGEEIRRLQRLRRKLSGRARILEQALEETRRLPCKGNFPGNCQDSEDSLSGNCQDSVGKSHLSCGENSTLAAELSLSYVSFPSRTYLFERSRDHSEKETMQSFINLCKLSQQLQIDFENPVCAVIPEEELQLIRETDRVQERRLSGYAILLPEDIPLPENALPQSDQLLTRAAGIYAVAYHQGSPEELPETFLKMVRRIFADGLEFCGDAYEEDLFSILTSADPQEYFRRIAIPVRHTKQEESHV